MVTDTIGRCDCIHPSDKTDIDRMITDNIDAVTSEILWLKNHRQELITFGTNVDELSSRYEMKKLNAKRLLIRIRNTPECK